MSELVLTGPLLDFGNSFWRSPLVMEEFPGLVSSGMQAIGRFGIGFFSVFMLGNTVRVTSRRCDKGDDSARVLEIKGGPSGRPIVWLATPGEAPIDGGTRVEVCLKAPPVGARGLLWNGSDQKPPLSLARVTAGLAPSLDVALTSGEVDNLTAVSGANDWISISAGDLLGRLDFRQNSEKSASAKSPYMRPMTDSDGKIYGRATITPEDYWNREAGWITVSGLRANRLSNLSGILVGEATTAARDIAQPLVPIDVLIAWATEQAELLGESRIDEERKAKSAETILECGGDIGQLPIARWGEDWMSRTDFRGKIEDRKELVINFEGEFSYDEDEDAMHPREFKEEFE